MIKGVRGLLLFSVIMALFLVPNFPDLSTGSEPIIERYVLTGSVINNRTNEGLKNYTVTVEKEGFRSISNVTDINGTYEFILPPGNFTISVYTNAGILVGQKILIIGPHLTNHWDFQMDPNRFQRARYYGRIEDDLGDGVVGAIVYMKQTNSPWDMETYTDSKGRFSMYVPSGQYMLIITYNEKERVNETVVLNWAETREANYEIDLSDERPLASEIYDFLVSHWIDLIVLFVILLAILIFYGVFLGISQRIKKRNPELYENEWFVPVRKFIGRISILGICMIILRQISRMSNPIEELIWSWAPSFGLAILGVLAVLLVMRLLLQGDHQLWEYVRKKKGSKGTVILPPQIISLLEVISRYLILFVGGTLILLMVLSAFGMSDSIIHRVGDFFSNNAGELLFLIILIVLAVLVKKFIDIFFTEFGTRATKINPQVMDMSKKGLTGLSYFIIVLIFMFTILSIGGLGEIGETFILVISMIVGLVVSFAATGSIGNILSGLVLVSMKPFDVGDRVEVNNGMIGDVENLGIMFTRIRDLESRIIEIPNNNILASNITNFSKSATESGFAVYVDVTLGYEIHPKTARSLMKRAALTSPGVLKEPTPKVLVRDFQNHAVEYRLRAYVHDSKNMLFIRSSIMESMLAIFHQEGLEILSPLYHVKREGNEPTKEELGKRIPPLVKEDAEDASGLTMFDGLGSD